MSNDFPYLCANCGAGELSPTSMSGCSNCGSQGAIIPNPTMDDLAAEAERGYDPAKITSLHTVPDSERHSATITVHQYADDFINDIPPTVIDISEYPASVEFEVKVDAAWNDPVRLVVRFDATTGILHVRSTNHPQLRFTASASNVIDIEPVWS